MMEKLNKHTKNYWIFWEYLKISCRSNNKNIHTWELHLKLGNNFFTIFIYNINFQYNFSIQWKWVNKELKFYNYDYSLYNLIIAFKSLELTSRANQKIILILNKNFTSNSTYQKKKNFTSNSKVKRNKRKRLRDK